MHSSRKSRRYRGQRGVILLMLLVGLALLIIAMTVAVPKISQALKREREIEMIHRGVQYSRAVKKFYKKFGRYPTSLEQLENTNNIRFLRKRYADPMSADGKWRFVRYGEVQLGQTGSSTPGAGGSGGVLPPVVGGPLGQPNSDTTPQPNAPQNSGPGGTGLASGPGNPSQGTLFQSGGNNGVFGGGPMLGVASTSEKQGIHEYDKKSKYNQWLFVYVPELDRGGLINGPFNPKAFVGQANQNGTPASNLAQPPTTAPGTTPVFGQPPGGTPQGQPQQTPPQ